MTRKKLMTIHDVIETKFDLAKIYADDGAFHSAARVLEGLAKDVKAHAVWCDKQMEEMCGK